MAKKGPSLPVTAKRGFAGADYNYAAVNANLKLISLVSTSFHVNPDCVSEQKKWKLGYSWADNACRFDSDRGVVSAIFEYIVTAKLGRKTAMRCIAEYVILYAVPSNCESEAAEGFCHNVGAFAAYPYFRGLVSQLASSANLVLPPLPSIASTAHVPKKQVVEE